MHTVLELCANPSFFKNYKTGIIPTTYCRLNSNWLLKYNFGTVLDIGANVGRFSITFHALFPNAKIHAFEPLPACYNTTLQAVRKIKAVNVHPVALGDSSGTIEMFANDFSPSSSILPMAQTHKEAFPTTTKMVKVPIQVSRLDDIADGLNFEGPIFVKIDVQGFEKAVLLGGANTIRKADVVLIELSFEQLYENQPLFSDIYDIMRELGFSFQGTMAQMLHPKDERILDADCFFVRGLT
jgi:FkbM family methyltransferase